MPPSIQLKRFKGLTLVGGRDDGQIDELQSALNAQFDEDGVIEARRGFHFLGNLATGDQAMSYMGYLVPYTYASSGGILLAGATGYYKYTGTKTNVNLTKVWTGTPGSVYRGVQYDTKLYMLDGKNWNGSTIGTTTGFPTSVAGCITTHADRLWTADRETNRLKYCEPGDTNNWPSTNFIDVGRGDGGTIQDIKSYRNRLFIFKTNSVWVLDTPGVPTSWTLRKYSADSCSGISVVEYEGMLYWVGGKGAYSFDGSAIKLISAPIQSLWSDGRWQETTVPASVRTTVYDGNLIMFFEDAQQASATYSGRRIFCYSIRHNAWTEWSVGWDGGLTLNAYPISIFSVDNNNGVSDIGAGIYMTTIDFSASAHGHLVATEINGVLPSHMGGGDIPDWQDYLGTRVSVPDVETAYNYGFSIQTLWSDFQEMARKKRNTTWTIEFGGGSRANATNPISFIQTDENGRTKTAYMTGEEEYFPTPSTAISVRAWKRLPGIGYFRRLSLTISVSSSDFQYMGFKLHNLHAQFKVRGPQIDEQTETYT